jgi:hypothetical protein
MTASALTPMDPVEPSRMTRRGRAILGSMCAADAGHQRARIIHLRRLDQSVRGRRAKPSPGRRDTAIGAFSLPATLHVMRSHAPPIRPTGSRRRASARRTRAADCWSSACSWVWWVRRCRRLFLGVADAATDVRRLVPAMLAPNLQASARIVGMIRIPGLRLPAKPAHCLIRLRARPGRVVHAAFVRDARPDPVRQPPVQSFDRKTALQTAHRPREKDSEWRRPRQAIPTTSRW